MATPIPFEGRDLRDYLNDRSNRLQVQERRHFPQAPMPAAPGSAVPTVSFTATKGVDTTVSWPAEFDTHSTLLAKTTSDNLGVEIFRTGSYLLTVNCNVDCADATAVFVEVSATPSVAGLPQTFSSAGTGGITYVSGFAVPSIAVDTVIAVDVTVNVTGDPTNAIALRLDLVRYS